MYNNPMDPTIPQPQNLTTPELLPPPKHFLNKKFAITFVILLLLGGGAYAGIWYWGNQQQSDIDTFEECAKAKDSKILETYPEQCVTSDGQTFTNLNQKVDSTETWKTYINTQYGFKFKYPSDEVIEDRNGYIRAQNYSSDDDSPGLKKGEYYLEHTISNYDCVEGLENMETKNVNGHDVIFGFGPYGGDMGGDRKTLCAKNYKNINIQISVTFHPDSLVLADQILSTFKFIDTAVGTFCGGIAGKLCPSGYSCKLDGSYPDAGGTCIKAGMACTEEAKQCPDGSYVGRTGPNCEFTACPK